MTDIQGQIDRILDAVRSEAGIPGLAVCVERNGQRWFSSSGTARAGTEAAITRRARFDVSCLMKFFLSVTALKLKALKNLDLQADISSRLADMGSARGIRLIHLMSHASGYHGLDITDMAVRWNSRWEGFAARFRAAAQLFPPGQVFNYEHSEHVILGRVLQEIFTELPSTLIHDILLSPAGVDLRAAPNDTGLCAHAFSAQRRAYVPTKLPPFGPFWEASLPAMTITLDDVVSAVGAVLADPEIETDLRTPLIGLPMMARSEGRAEQPPRQFSAACGLYGEGILGHNGSIHGQTVGFRVDTRTGIVAAAGVNAYSPYARDKALRRILSLFGAEQPSAQAAPADRYAREDIFADFSPEDVEGRYIGSYLGEVSVIREGHGLSVIVGPPGNRQSRFKISAEGGRRTIQSSMPVALCFQRAADGGAILFLGVHAYKPISV